MDLRERKHVATVINYFWGPGITTADRVNDSAAIVAYSALKKARVCSEAMDLVPRPAYGPLGPKYAIKKLVKIGERIVSDNNRIYSACKAAVRIAYKSEIQIALMGG